jgi:hypothetical protein
MPPGGIRTHNPSKRAAAHSRLRPRGTDVFTYGKALIVSIFPHKHCFLGLSGYILSLLVK